MSIHWIFQMHQLILLQMPFVPTESGEPSMLASVAILSS